MNSIRELPKHVKLTILVAALGYFVDVFDLILFSIVRVASLRDLGVSGEDLMGNGILLLNAQMAGMLVGGLAFGILGDKKGRLSVLFGSILLYSLSNLANAFVHDIPTYAVLRFVSGFGLAGELGAGISIVAEMLPKNKRGLGTTFVASIGVLGAVVASVVTEYMHWRTSYMVAGVLGLLLLILRFSLRESEMFQDTKQASHIARGDLRMLLGNKKRFQRFVLCILPGLPIWFCLGILVTFGPELLQFKQVPEVLTAGKAVFYCYVGFFIGDIGSGLLSQAYQSRKRVIREFILGGFISAVVFLYGPFEKMEFYYFLYVLLGTFAGFWAVFITNAAEQFGTNLRATVATSVPNFIRGSVLILTAGLSFLRPLMGPIHASLVLSGLCATFALFALWRLEESFSKSLDFHET